MKRTIALFVDGLSVPAKEGLTAHHLELAEHLASSENWLPLMVVADRDRASHDALKSLPYDTVLMPADEYYDKQKVGGVLRRYNVAIAQNYNPHYFSTILSPAARDHGIPTLFEVHDYEKDLDFMNRSDEETDLNAEAQRIAIKSATHTRIMSKHDYEQILRHYEDIPHDRLTWLPFGATRRTIMRRPDASHVLFIGNSSYPPNAEACRYIIEEIAPRMPDVSFHLIGRETHTFPVGHNVMAHGEVDDLEPWLEKGAVGVAPISMGSGMKIKLLTYLSASIPCVATPVAMAGFPHDERAISIAESAEDFVAAIYDKLSDTEAPLHADKYFTQYFDAKNMFAEVERMYEQAMNREYSWEAPAAGEFDASRLHWLKEAANSCFGKTVNVETHIAGDASRPKKPIIVVEGLPGAGKTSLINKLRELAPTVGFVDEVPYPIMGDDEVAYYENDVLKHRLAETMSADCVIMDRNYCSTLAYAYARSRIEGDESIYEEAEAWVTSQLEEGRLCRPDAYIHISISPEVSVARRREQSADWRDVEFAKHVAQWYDSFFKELPACPVFGYDAMIPTEELAQKIKSEKQLRQLTFAS